MEVVEQRKQNETINELKHVLVFLSTVLAIILFVCKQSKMANSHLTLILNYGLLCLIFESYLQEQHKVLILIGFLTFFQIITFQMKINAFNNGLLILIIIYSSARYAQNNHLNGFNITNFIFLQLSSTLLPISIANSSRKNCSLFSHSNQSFRTNEKFNMIPHNNNDQIANQVQIQILKNLQEMSQKRNSLFDKSLLNEQKLDQPSIQQLNIKNCEENLLDYCQNYKNLQTIKFPAEIFLQKQEPSVKIDREISQNEENVMIQSGIELKQYEGLVMKSLNFSSMGLAIVNKSKQLVFYNKPLKRHLSTFSCQKELDQTLFSIQVQLKDENSNQRMRAQTVFPKRRNSSQQFIARCKDEDFCEDVQFISPQKSLSSRINKEQAKSLSPKQMHRPNFVEQQQSHISRSYKRISIELNQIGQKRNSNIPNNSSNNNYFNYSIQDVLKYSDNLGTIQEAKQRASLNNDNNQCSIKWLGSENNQSSNLNYKSNNLRPNKINNYNQQGRPLPKQNRLSGQLKNVKYDQLLLSTTCSSVSNKKGTLKSCSFISSNKTLLDHLKSQQSAKLSSSNFTDQNSRYTSCIIPASIEKLFQISGLSLEDIVNFLLKNAQSSQQTKFKTDHIIYQENEEEENNNNDDSDSSFNSKISQNSISNQIQKLQMQNKRSEMQKKLNSQRNSCGQYTYFSSQSQNQNKPPESNLCYLEEDNCNSKLQTDVNQPINLQFQSSEQPQNNQPNQNLDQFQKKEQNYKIIEMQLKDNESHLELPPNNDDSQFKLQQIQEKRSEQQNLEIKINQESQNQRNNLQSQSVIFQAQTKQGQGNSSNKKRQNEEKKSDQKHNESVSEQYSYFINNNHLHVIVKIEKSYFEIVLCCLVSKDNENDKYVMIEMNEITQLKRQVDNENLKRYKQRIFSSISHELRTPLNCSIQMLDLLSQNEDIHQNIKEIFIFPALYSNQLLLNIINDILDLAQIDYGQFKMNFDQFELEKICIECLNLISIQAIQKKITLDLEFDLAIPKIINSDSNRLRQVLLNLLSNALKFTQEGKIQIKAYLVEENLIKIDVEDTGCGIPKVNLNKIIGQFSKKFSEKEEEVLDWDNKEKNSLNTQGAGLGLTIANNLAAGLGGNRVLKVQSQENKGSIFSFFIINNPITKKGCQYKSTDIFNKQIINWEYFSESSIPNKEEIKQKNHILSIPNYSPMKQESQKTLAKMKTPASLSQINENNIIQNSLTTKNEQRKNSISLSIINENFNLIQNSLSKYQQSYDNLQQCPQKYANGKDSEHRPSQQSQQPSENSLRTKNIYTISCVQIPNQQGGIASDYKEQTRQSLYQQNRKSTSSQSNSLRQSSMATYLHIQEFNNDFQFSLSSKSTDGELKIISNNEMGSKGSTSTILTITNSKEDQKEAQQGSSNRLQMHDLEKTIYVDKSITVLPCDQKKGNQNSLRSKRFSQELTLEDKQLQNLQNILQKSEQQYTKKLNDRKTGNISNRFCNVSASSDNNSPLNQDTSLIKSYSPSSKNVTQNDIQLDDIDETCILNGSECYIKHLPNQFSFKEISLKRGISSQKRSCYNRSSSSTRKTCQESQSQYSENIHDQNDILLCHQEDQLHHTILDLGERKLIENTSFLSPNSDEKLEEISFSIDREQSNQRENSVSLIKGNSKHSFAANNNISQQIKGDILNQNAKQSTSNNQLSNEQPISSEQIKKNSEKLLSSQQQLSESNKIYLNYNKNINQPQKEGSSKTSKEKLIYYNQNKKKCQCTNALIVDDNEFNIYALEIRLNQYKFIIDKATSGDAAIQFVHKKTQSKCCKYYDIIFMDIDMPVKNGYETTEEIISFFKSSKASKYTPISACTAFVQESEKQRAKQSGMQYYITKPINQQTLENVLECAILNQLNQ